MSARTSNQLVSIIIPAYNAAAYIGEAIASALAQDWNEREIIIVDDGSTDGLAEAVGGFGARVKVLSGPHQGLAASRNRGISSAVGDYILHLDADDKLRPGAIRTLMAAFGAEPDCDIVAGRLQCFLSPDVPDDVALRLVVPSEPQAGHLSGVAIIRSAAVRRLGMLDPAYHPAADLEWWLRARGAGTRMIMRDDVVLDRRIHGGNMSIIQAGQLSAATLKLVRASLARNRLPGA